MKEEARRKKEEARRKKERNKKGSERLGELSTLNSLQEISHPVSPHHPPIYLSDRIRPTIARHRHYIA